MSNSDSFSKAPLSQVVENPSSFNFSTPTPEESPSVLVCGVVEMVESISPQTVVVPSPVFPFNEALRRNPWQNLMLNLSLREMEVWSLAVSFTISERLFEGDLSEGKNINWSSCIKSLTEVNLCLTKPLDPSVLRMMRKRGIRGRIKMEKQRCARSKYSQISAHELETIKGAPEDASTTKRAGSTEERKRKGKGKLIKAHLKGENKRKVLGSVMEANATQTERIRTKRQKGLLVVEPISTHVPVEDSEDITRYVAKRKRDAEEESLKSKGTQKRGPHPRVQNQSEEEEMTREERIEKIEHQRVLKGRVFDTDIITKFGGGITTTVRDVKICLDEETLGIILGVHVAGIRTIEGCKPIEEFTKLAIKR
ncbi:hypothetical protein H5410_015831 [Solanum commersonii]|uniref:Uncharacterized protein n=1 Tax=Solanum commersonii TaxID=4109 RepID=A0A9J5ZVQ3_SOLCO|nr:hypothetical protein H5410_015831 [Solanum commersonii]